MNIGWQEILLILFIALLLFGAKKIPDLARSMGKGIKEFKKGLNEIENPSESKKSKEANEKEADKQTS
ncbi:MAG: twin-arginine translocase TatA/TatE family subunit [bacterium]